MWRIVLVRFSSLPLVLTTSEKRARTSLHLLANKTIIDANDKFFQFTLLFCLFCQSTLAQRRKTCSAADLAHQHYIWSFTRKLHYIFFYYLSLQYLKTSFQHRLIIKDDDIQFLSCPRQYLIEHLALRIAIVICH